MPVFPAGAGLTGRFSARALHGDSSAGFIQNDDKTGFL
jgi:hypothetical protein